MGRARSPQVISFDSAGITIEVLGPEHAGNSYSAAALFAYDGVGNIIV